MHQPSAVNSFCSSGTIWQHKSGSTVAQVMACYLTELSHCWLTFNEVRWHLAVSQKLPKISLTTKSLRKVSEKKNAVTSPRDQWVKLADITCPLAGVTRSPLSIDHNDSLQTCHCSHPFSSTEPEPLAPHIVFCDMWQAIQTWKHSPIPLSHTRRLWQGTHTNWQQTTWRKMDWDYIHEMVF